MDNSEHTQQQNPDMAQRRQQMAEQDQVIAQRLAQINHTIAVISGKGGVGKTTLATAIANKLASWSQCSADDGD